MQSINHRTSVISIFAVIISTLSTGCSVYKAATQPGPADLSGLGVGTRR